MRNLGGRFEDVSQQAGPAFQVPLAARGAAFGDLNNDGRPDIVVSVLDGPALVLRNASPPENYWLLVNTVGHAQQPGRHRGCAAPGVGLWTRAARLCEHRRQLHVLQRQARPLRPGE